MSKYYCKLCIGYLRKKINGNTAHANVKNFPAPVKKILIKAIGSNIG